MLWVLRREKLDSQRFVVFIVTEQKLSLAVLVEAESPKEIDILQCSQFTVTACSCLRKCFYPQAANFDKKNKNNKNNNKSQW